jgi:RNA 2',3'-cyclic 3'-phosphodiesterase
VADGERIRLFCALQLPVETRDGLAAWAGAHIPEGAGRLVRHDDLHVTLAFLGTRPAGEVPEIAHELRAASESAAPIELRPRRYRETRSVGMLVLDDVDGAAGALADDIQTRLERLGVYRREGRPWLAHVTVLRFRARAGLALAPPNMCSIHVVRSALYRSTPGPGGARYDALETAPLGDSGGS